MPAHARYKYLLNRRNAGGTTTSVSFTNRQTPEKSDRAIAAEIGVSDKTVAKARRATADKSAVEKKRTGKDGKARKMPKSAP
jgi:hypothetical protein